MSISEASLRDRIKNLAQSEGRSVNEVLKQLYLERFLARLARSEYADKFIFKGGSLLAFFIELGRETKDLDFLVTKLAAESPTLEAAFKAIASVETEDGFVLRYGGLERLGQEHMNYPGFRATLEIQFKKGTLRDNIQIDLGVGDLVTPESQALELLKHRDRAFFEATVSLLVYPAETIYAEKLETVLSKGGVNSRMKDFHDLILMSREAGLLVFDRLGTDIKATFAHRGTELRLPLDFQDRDYDELQTHWSRHLRGFGELAGTLNLPAHIKQVVLEINDFLGRPGLFVK